MLKVVFLLFSINPGHSAMPSYFDISYSREECAARKLIREAEAKRQAMGDIKYECHRYALKD